MIFAAAPLAISTKPASFAASLLDIMGRKSEGMYNRYRIVDDSEKRIALKRMQEYLEHASSELAEQGKPRTMPATVQ